MPNGSPSPQRFQVPGSREEEMSELRPVPANWSEMCTQSTGQRFQESWNVTGPLVILVLHSSIDQLSTP